MQNTTFPSHPHLRGTQSSAATLEAFSLGAFWTHLPPPVGAAELIACTMSVVRASSKLVINSTFFPSGQPAERKEGFNARTHRIGLLSQFSKDQPEHPLFVTSAIISVLKKGRRIPQWVSLCGNLSCCFCPGTHRVSNNIWQDLVSSVASPSSLPA